MTQDLEWTGQPVILYDRCAEPGNAVLAARLDECRAFAAGHAAPVLDVAVDYGDAAVLDGLRDDAWIAIAEARPALKRAIRTAVDSGAWVLVWHPDRVSWFIQCREPVIRALGGRLLRLGGGRVEAQLLSAGASPYAP